MKILIIGNGFDVAHGLHTKYTDFLDYIIDNSSDCYLTNSWIRYFRYLKEYQRFRGEKWIDFEDEIKKVLYHIMALPISDPKDGSRHLLYSNEPIESVLNNANVQVAIEDDRIAYIEKLESELKRLIDILDGYMNAMDSKSINCISPDIKALDIDKILSFNYTNTYNRVYKKMDDNDFCFIHGQVGKRNIVLGYESNRDEDPHRVLDIKFKKFFQRIHNTTENVYNDWLKNKYIELYFFGHSFGESDREVLSELMLHPNVERITVFYHTEESKTSLITNICKIIGEDTIKKLSVEGRLVFQKLKDMI